MNKRINDLIINLNNSENKTTDLKRNSLLSDEIKEQKRATGGRVSYKPIKLTGGLKGINLRKAIQLTK